MKNATHTTGLFAAERSNRPLVSAWPCSYGADLISKQMPEQGRRPE